MYCSRCGKEIDYDARFCVECAKELAYESALAASRAAEIKAAKAAEAEAEKAEAIPEEPIANQAPAYVVPVARPAGSANSAPVSSDPNEAKFGLGKAIGSLVMSNVAVFLTYFSIFAAIASPGFAMFLLFASLPLAIISLVQGIKSIKAFTSRSRAGYKKPVATLVLGIIGLATAALALLLFIIYFFMIVAIIELNSGYYYY